MAFQKDDISLAVRRGDGGGDDDGAAVSAIATAASAVHFASASCVRNL